MGNKFTAKDATKQVFVLCSLKFLLIADESREEHKILN